METFEQRLGDLASRHALTVTQEGDGWLIDLPQRDSLTCQLSIGPEALDWYATVLDSADGRKVLTDWMDYLGYEKRPVEDLVRDKLRDLAWFIEAWLGATELRVTRVSKLMGLVNTTTVEWNHQNHWEPIQLNDPNR